MTDIPETLLPCPFCGGTPRLLKGGPGNNFVRCDQCNAGSDDGVIERAIAAWNRRTAQAERMARLEEALRVFARIADIEDYLDTPDGSSVMVNVSLCRAARRALSQEGSDA